ncbi:extracellular solute-binding protein [Nocardia sp. AG03]|uniref:extracellular solute-binding protein n=1 Tax=Nocardia sp. AG03 TaxID=3025312 RepID=UPI0024185312|nr:extracellular solute-binding protein [Nocardia sp. AG03]
MIVRGGWVLAAMLVVVFGVGGCGSSAGRDEITVYSGQDVGLVAQWAAAFTARTGIEVIVRSGGDAGLGELVLAEGDDSPADVFLSANAPVMTLVERAGLFAELDRATVDQVPERYRPASDDWVGTTARTTGFVYNVTSLPIAELPASMLDLAQPAWRGRWAAATASSDFQAIVAGLLAQRGEDATRAWLRGVRANAVTLPDGAAVVAAVSTGRPESGLVFGSSWATERQPSTALRAYSGRDPGAFLSVAGGAVLRSSAKQEQARQFLAFVTGGAGQYIVRDGGSMRYPVAADIDADPALPPLTDLSVPVIDPARLDAVRADALLTEAGLR